MHNISRPKSLFRFIRQILLVITDWFFVLYAPGEINSWLLYQWWLPGALAVVMGAVSSSTDLWCLWRHQMVIFVSANNSSRELDLMNKSPSKGVCDSHSLNLTIGLIRTLEKTLGAVESPNRSALNWKWSFLMQKQRYLLCLGRIGMSRYASVSSMDVRNSSDCRDSAMEWSVSTLKCLNLTNPMKNSNPGWLSSPCSSLAQ